MIRDVIEESSVTIQVLEYFDYSQGGSGWMLTEAYVLKARSCSIPS